MRMDIRFCGWPLSGNCTDRKPFKVEGSKTNAVPLYAIITKKAKIFREGVAMVTKMDIISVTVTETENVPP